MIFLTDKFHNANLIDFVIIKSKCSLRYVLRDETFALSDECEKAITIQNN